MAAPPNLAAGTTDCFQTGPPAPGRPRDADSDRARYLAQWPMAAPHPQQWRVVLGPGGSVRRVHALLFGLAPGTAASAVAAAPAAPASRPLPRILSLTDSVPAAATLSLFQLPDGPRAPVAYVVLPNDRRLAIPLTPTSTAGVVLAAAVAAVAPRVLPDLSRWALFDDAGYRLEVFDELLPRVCSPVASQSAPQLTISIPPAAAHPDADADDSPPPPTSPLSPDSAKRRSRLARLSRSTSMLLRWSRSSSTSSRRPPPPTPAPPATAASGTTHSSSVETALLSGVGLNSSIELHLVKLAADVADAQTARLVLDWPASYNPPVTVSLSRPIGSYAERVALAVTAWSLHGVDPLSTHLVLEFDGSRAVATLRTLPSLAGGTPSPACAVVGGDELMGATLRLDVPTSIAGLAYERDARRLRRAIRRRARLKALLKVKASLKAAVKELRTEQPLQPPASLTHRRLAELARGEAAKAWGRESKNRLLEPNAVLATDLASVYEAYVLTSEHVATLKTAVRSLPTPSPAHSVLPDLLRQTKPE